MAKLQLIIQGKDYTNSASGLEVFDILVTENSDKTIVRSISQQIIVKDRAYDLINEQFFDGCLGYMNEIDCSVTIPLCGSTTFVGKITAEGLELDEVNKEAKILIKGKNEEANAYGKLAQDYIFENGFLDAIDHPIIHYTKQNSSTGMMILLRNAVQQILYPLVLVSKAIAAVIVAICEIVDGITFWKDLKCPTFQEVDLIDNLLELMDRSITGNGRWGVGIIAREALEYQCKIAGVQFSSSILNNPASPYYNMTIWGLTGGKFGYKNKTKAAKIEILNRNSPLMTSIDFLESIKDAFAADFKIIGDTLYFENLDFFDQFRVNKIEYDKCNKYIFKYNIFETYAYLEAFYENDQYDQEGNKNYFDYYQNKLEFNNPPKEAQKGKKSVILKYSPTKFMFDQATLDQEGFFDADFLVDIFKSRNPVIFDIQIEKRDRDMVITSDSTSGYKLLILEDNFDRQDAKVIRRRMVQDQGPDLFFEYNYPMYFKGGLEAYLGNFNPRLSKRSLSTDRIEIQCNCDAIEAILNVPYSIYLASNKGKICPKTYAIKVDMVKGKAVIEMSDTVVLC